MREEIHRHMDVTEDLTNKARGNNKSFLSAANGKNFLFNGHRHCTLNQVPLHMYFEKFIEADGDTSRGYQCGYVALTSCMTMCCILNDLDS